MEQNVLSAKAFLSEPSTKMSIYKFSEFILLDLVVGCKSCLENDVSYLVTSSLLGNSHPIHLNILIESSRHKSLH